MDSDQDPVERAAEDGVDLHAVSTWETRSPLDYLAYGIYLVGSLMFKWLLVGVGIWIVYRLYTVSSLDAVTDPHVTMLVVLSVVPAIALATYVRFANVTTSESFSAVLVTFLLGILFAGFAIPFNRLGEAIVYQHVPIEAAAVVLLYLLVVGPVEETVKLLAVRLFAFRSSRFDAVIDGAVYGAAAGLGFATIENALYITDPLQQTGSATAVLAVGGEVAASRALAGPGHVLYSAIAGYYLGLAKFNRKYAWPIVIKGLLVAALFHGVYNVGTGVVPELLATVEGITGFAALVIYVVGFNAVVASYLYARLKRYRETYRAVKAGDRPAESRSSTAAEVDAPPRHWQGIERKSTTEIDWPTTNGQDDGREREHATRRESEHRYEDD